MLSKRERPQDTLFVCGSLRDLIPSDHVLARVHRVLDLSWLGDAVADCYHAHLGRASIDPEAAVRLMLAGLLLGIVHDRRLMREAQVNLAIRWFAGFDLQDRIPHHSSLSKLRARWGAERFEAIFQRTVEACVTVGLASGEVVHVDATLIRADASWESLARVHVAAVVAENDAAAGAVEATGPADTPAEDTEGSAGGAPSGAAAKGRMVKRSRTDADARMATSRRDHRLEPSYKQLTAVDGASGVVLDAFTVMADRHEGGTLAEQLERIEGLTGTPAKLVTADKGYASAANYKMLEARRIDAVIPPQRVRKARVPLARFRYDAHHDLVRCPKGRKLRPASRAGKDGRFYRARRANCQACPLAEICLPKTAKSRSVIIKDGYPALLRARRRHAHRLPEDRHQQNRHRGLVEGVHGEEKAWHGLARATRRGLWNMAIQAWLTAAAINLKRLAAFIIAAIRRLWGPFQPIVRALTTIRAIISLCLADVAPVRLSRAA